MIYHGDFIRIAHSYLPVDISVIIPVYNESKNIKPLVQMLSRSLRPSIRYEIIFIDDGSTDGTEDIIRALQKKSKGIIYKNRHKKLGLSSAVVDGLRLARGEYVCVMDGDLQHDPKYIPEMYRFISKNPDSLVIGSRFIKKIGNPQRMDSKVGTFICRHIFNINVYDPLSGFFMLERKKFLSLLPRINPIGYKILLEILAKGRFSHIKEIPIIFHMREQGSSKLDLKTRLEFLTQLVQLFFTR